MIIELPKEEKIPRGCRFTQFLQSEPNLLLQPSDLLFYRVAV